MSNGVIIAIIGAIPALITAVVSIAMNNRVLTVKLEAIEKRLDRMEKKQDETNHVKERIAVLERDNKTAFNKIDENRNEITHLRDQVASKA